MYEIMSADMKRGQKLLRGAIFAPLLLTLIPAVITLVMMFLAPLAPPSAVIVLFLGLVATTLGFLTGLTVTGVLLHKRSQWTKEMRERIAADGIRAEEINWFFN